MANQRPNAALNATYKVGSGLLALGAATEFGGAVYALCLTFYGSSNEEANLLTKAAESGGMLIAAGIIILALAAIADWAMTKKQTANENEPLASDHNDSLQASK